MIRSSHKEVFTLRTRLAYEGESVADPMLPWADPYLVKLVQQLEREAREQIEAAFREDEANDEDYPNDFEELDAPVTEAAPRWSLDEAPISVPYAVWLN